MIVTGYMLRAAIRRHEQKRDVAARLFADSLYAFPSDEKESPIELAKAFAQAELMIATLQTLQMRYNLTVHVGTGMPLASAIKMIGGAGRLEGMWKSALPERRDRYYGQRMETRSAGDEVASLAVSMAEVEEHLGKARQRADDIRNQIGVGNAVEIEFEDEYSLLFE